MKFAENVHQHLPETEIIFGLLSPELREAFGYDAAAEKEFSEGQARAEAARRRQEAVSKWLAENAIDVTGEIEVLRESGAVLDVRSAERGAPLMVKTKSL